MAAKSPNMKVNVTADNSELNKKMKESKAAVQDFEKVGSDAVSKLGQAFGINVDQVQKLGSAVNGLGVKLQGSGKTGVAAMGKLLSSVSMLSAGVAAVGIAGLVAGFKALKDEAEAFKNTVQGANIELETQAYISTYKQFLHDLNEGIGEGAANAESGWKKFWGTIGSDIKLLFTTPGGFGTTEGLTQIVQAQAEAMQFAQSAADIAKEMYYTQRAISDKTVEWARMEREIAEYKRVAYDKTTDTAIQQDAINKAVQLTIQRFQEEADLQARLADLLDENNSLVSSSPEDIDKANQQRIIAERVTAALSNALRELSERQVAIADAAKKEAEARKQAAEAAAQLTQSRKDLAAWDSAVSTDLTNVSGATALSSPGIAIPVTPVLDTTAAVDLSNQLESIITAATETIGLSIGTLIGDLTTGGDAWNNFANTAISAFGDMAISVGKLAISTGVATLGIKAALASLNGYVAIAAGVALVALGSAVKTGLTNIANGGYSASTNVASAGSYSSSNIVNTTFDQESFDIRVTGELRASGNQLVAVIEREQLRKNHTT